MELKPGYKQMDVGILPEEWDSMSCADLCVKIQDGTHFSPKVRGHDYLYLTSKNIRFGFLDISTAEQVDTAQHEAIYKRCDVKPGDLLLTKDGANTGNAALNTLTEQFSLLSSVAFLRFDAKKHSAAYFLQQVLSTQGQQRIKDSMSGNAITRLTLEKIRNLRFPVAPLSEQRAIATSLCDVDALLDELERLIAKKRDLKQAAMQQLLTGQTRLPGFSGKWEMKQLGDLSEIVSGGTPKTNEPSYWNGGIKWCTPTDITGCAGKYLLDTERTISRLGLNSSGSRFLPAGALLLCSRATIGEVKIAGNEICTNQGFKSLICKPEVSNEFLYYKLLTMKQQMIERAFGSTFLEISKANVAALEILVPPLTEQSAIATVLSDMDAELSALEARRDKTRALKQAMMQELLTGKTRLVTKPSNIVSVDFATNPKSAPPQQPASTSHNWQINEAVVIAVLVKQFGSEQYPLGRKRCTKLAYLMHRHVEHVAQGYLKKAAGPYNPAVKYKGPEGIAQKNSYIRAYNNGKFSGFVTAANIAQAESYFEQWYGPDVRIWLEQFRRQSNDELELLATVDMAVEDLKRMNMRTDVENVKSIIRKHSEWEAKLEREIFSDIHIARAIRRVIELFPTGDTP